MSKIKKGTWAFVFILGVLTAVSCDFKTQLTYFNVATHLVLITTFFFGIVVPPEELLDGLGLTLYDLFTIFYNPDTHGFFDFQVRRIAFFRTIVGLYPAAVCAYFVHGDLSMNPEAEVSRFPGILDVPHIWASILTANIAGCIVYFMIHKDFKKWSFYRYFANKPGFMEAVEELVQNQDTFRIKLSQHTHLYCTRLYFVYVSNWRFVAVRQGDLRMLVDNTRMPRIPNQDDEERLRFIFVKVNFRQSYLSSFTVNLRHDYYRQLNEILLIPIFVPPHITIPLTIMEELKEDFIARIRQNDTCRFRTTTADKDPCFACGSENNMVAIVKTCADNNQRWMYSREGYQVHTETCEICRCRPLWCSSCIAQIFIGRQNIEDIYRHDYWRGTGQCPTCRKTFCIRDVHLVEFDLEED